MIFLLPKFPVDGAMVDSSFECVLKNALAFDGSDSVQVEHISEIWRIIANELVRNHPTHVFENISVWGNKGQLRVSADYRRYPFVRLGVQRKRGPSDETIIGLDYPRGYLSSLPHSKGWIFLTESADRCTKFYGRPDDLYIFFKLCHGFCKLVSKNRILEKAEKVRMDLADVLSIEPIELTMNSVDDEEKFVESINRRLALKRSRGPEFKV